MFTIELADNTVISGAALSWEDVGRLVASKKTTVRQLILTDGFHFRESISGADAYYYFAEAEAIIKGGANIDGSGTRFVPLDPAVTAEEIAGFYSAETAQVIYENNIAACDSQTVELEKRLAALRATPITSPEIQNRVNLEISQKQGTRDGMVNRRAALLRERAVIMRAGGFIVTRRLERFVGKFPLDIDAESYRDMPSNVLHQKLEHWIGATIPESKMVVHDIAAPQKGDHNGRT